MYFTIVIVKMNMRTNLHKYIKRALTSDYNIDKLTVHFHIWLFCDVTDRLLFVCEYRKTAGSVSTLNGQLINIYLHK